MAGPYIHNTVVNAPVDLVLKPLVVNLTATTGAVASYSAMPGVIVAQTAAGTYTVTDTEGFYLCLGITQGFSQANGAIDAGLEVLVTPPASGVQTFTFRTITTAGAGTPVNVANATTISLMVAYRKNPVP